MPPIYELRVILRGRLRELLKLQKDNDAAGRPPVIGLDELINRAETDMEAEDVAWVREKISQLP